MAPLKVWQLQDLSLQAAARIMNSPAENRLKVLADISQNFPSYARTLSKASVPKDLKVEVKKNREAFMHGLTIQVRALHFHQLPILTLYSYCLKSELLRVRFSDTWCPKFKQNCPVFRHFTKLYKIQ